MTDDPTRTPAIKLARDLGLGSSYGPFQATLRGVSGADPLLTRIDEIVKAQIPGDSTRIHRLLDHRLLSVTYSEDRRLMTYHVAREIPEPDGRTWVEVEQAAIDQAARSEQHIRDEEWRRQQEHSEFFMAPAQIAAQAAAIQALGTPEVQGVIRHLIREEIAAAFAAAV